MYYPMSLTAELFDENLIVPIPINSTSRPLIFKSCLIQTRKRLVACASVVFLAPIDALEDHCHIKHTLIQQVKV